MNYIKTVMGASHSMACGWHNVIQNTNEMNEIAAARFILSSCNSIDKMSQHLNDLMNGKEVVIKQRVDEEYMSYTSIKKV